MKTAADLPTPELQAHVDAYMGYPAIQSDVMASGSISPIMAAAARLEPFILGQAPLLLSEEYSKEFGCSVYFKDETQLSVGSFKLRGALNKVLSLSAAERAAGFVTASAGNHAQGLAKAAQFTLGTATIFMPETTPVVKIRAVQELGADTVLAGQTFEEAEAAAYEFHANNPEKTFVHPFDDLDVIRGQGTVGLELFSQLQVTPTHIFAPVGGGGLLAGLQLAREEVGAHETLLYGVEPEESASFAHAHKQGVPVRLQSVYSKAEGAAVRKIGRLPFEILAGKRGVRPYVVDEDALAEATVELNVHFDRPVECTAALGFTAVRDYAETVGFAKDDVVVTILTGKHRDKEAYQELESSVREAQAQLTLAS